MVLTNGGGGFPFAPSPHTLVPRHTGDGDGSARACTRTSGRGFPFAPDESTLHGTNHSKGNTMHDRSRFSEIDMAASLPGKPQALRAGMLFAEAAHVDERVNRRYYEHLLMGIENRAAALGLAFTSTPGAGPARLSGEEVAALEQALLDARQRCCYALVPARERHLHVGREVADGGGVCWLQWILDALAERDIALIRADAASASTCAPRPGAIGP